MTARTLRWKRNEYGDWELMGVYPHYYQGIGSVEKCSSRAWLWSDGSQRGFSRTAFGAMSCLLRALGER